MEHIIYLFDRFQLDVTRRKLLSASGLVLPLSSRAMEALLLLVANAGQVIDKRRLMQTVWPDTIVEDNNLNQCILAIRKALGEAAGSNRFVMTVQGRGFCFVCPVRTKIQESSHEEPAARWPLSGASPARRTMDTERSSAATQADTGTDGAAAERGTGTGSHPRPGIHRSFWIGLALGAALAAIALLPFALH